MVPGGCCGAGFFDQPPELVQVKILRVDIDPVAGGLGDDRLLIRAGIAEAFS
jgi:hypothetical protein